MKRFFGFVKKELFHITRDVRTMVILIGIPVAQLLIFGYVITNEIKDAKIAILDRSKDEVTREIKDKLLSSGYFILERKLQSSKQIEAIFKKGEVKEVIVFESSFAKRLKQQNKAHIQILADASDPNTARLLVNYTSSIIHDYQQKHLIGKNIPLRILSEVRMIFNPEMEGAYMYVPGTMALILMLISAMMTSISIAREKELGTMEVLLVSPLRPFQIIAGKVMPYVGLSFINAITILLLGSFVFGLPIHGSLALLLVGNFLYITLALGLGIFISTISSTQQSAMFISLFALMLPTILLSGFIFPIENMPKVLQWISIFMPARWFIVIIKSIMLKGVGFGYIWQETLYLIGFTALFMYLSLRNFKTRLE